MKRNGFLLTLFLFVLSVCPAGAQQKDELLYKICFPREETSDKKVQPCEDEDCGLRNEEKEKPDPIVAKSQIFTPLGASDYGMLWGANNYRVIGESRVRALLYVIPTRIEKTTYYEKDTVLVPDNTIIQNAFFSAYGEYQGSSVSIAYRVEKRIGRKKEVSGGSPLLQMIDLHCSARKIKMYDNDSIYYRITEPQDRQSSCFELLWEKPRLPLRWQPVSPMTVDILAEFYCEAMNAKNKINVTQKASE